MFDQSPNEMLSAAAPPNDAATFRLQAKTVFVTYPQADFDHSAYFNWVNDKWPLKSAIVATEQHIDGNYHMHALLKFKNKPDLRTGSLDYLEKHPNIGKVKNLAATTTYVKKDGNYTEFGMVLNL